MKEWCKRSLLAQAPIMNVLNTAEKLLMCILPDMMENKKTDGLKFAVTLLAAFGTIIFTAYNYFQNTSVDIFWYASISGVIVVLIILSTLLIVYISIKGILIEVPDCDLKNSMEKYISGFYLVSFITTIQTLIIVLSIFFLMKYLTILFIFEILISIGIFILIYNIKFISNSISIIIIGVCSLLLVSIIFWIPLYDIILTSPLQPTFPTFNHRFLMRFN